MKKFIAFVFLIAVGHITKAQITDSLDNLIYTVSSDWKPSHSESYKQFTFYGKDKSFCRFAIYKAQPSSGNKTTDFENEWKALVEKNFSVFTLASPTVLKNNKGVSFQRLGAKAVGKDGNKYYVQLNVYDCGNAIQSVIAVSGNQKQLQQYDPLWQSLITGVRKNKMTPSSVTTVTSTSTEPVAPADKTILGRWGKTYNPMLPYTNDQSINLAFSGYKRTQYIFKSDGTYSFQGEAWGGKENGYKHRLKNEKEYGLIDEAGTYQITGKQLTISPAKNMYRVVEKDGKLLRSETFPLQKRTYTWQRYYNPGMEENILVLTADKENEMDGEFSSFEAAVSFPKSYGYSLNKNMFFTFLPLDLSVAANTSTNIDTKLAGIWHKSSGSPSAYTNGVLTNLSYSGYTKGEYHFKTDGTYIFQGESWSGYYNSNEYRLIDEKGVFAVNGNQLNITPSASLYRVVDSDGNLKKSEKLSLDKRTYIWQTHYYEGLQETALVLTAKKENAIDGGFASSTQFPDSFIYSPGKKLEFRFQPYKF
jgi:hypothetical protein